MNIIIAKEIEDVLRSVIKHALFGTRDSLHSTVNSLDPSTKAYMLLNLTKFTNNLIDLISKIKVNTEPFNLLIKDITETRCELDNIKIIDDSIYFKSNHLLEFSDNLMIRSMDYKLQLNMYDSLIDVLMVFFFNDKYTQYLKNDNMIYAKLKFDVASLAIKNIFHA